MGVTKAAIPAVITPAPSTEEVELRKRATQAICGYINGDPSMGASIPVADSKAFSNSDEQLC
jgi:hypothetical protein